MTDAASSVNQDDYMKLFMQELTYQDPLKPMDNREFMAQMAQFSTLQQVQMSNDYLGGLLGTTNGNQSLLLLGKMVKIEGSDEYGKVVRVEFSRDEPPKLTLDMNGRNVTKNLIEVTEVSQ